MQPLLAVALLATACALQPRTVIVTGATGKTGQAVVQALLRDEATTIRCFVRNKTKAELVLPQDPRVRLCSVDLEDQAALAELVKDGEADAAIWCATGLTADKLLIDQVSLPTLAKALPRVSRDAAPNCVMLSSAAVTRPSWSSRKQKRFARSYDIPIVRLNPAGILGKKLNAEKKRHLKAVLH